MKQISEQRLKNQPKYKIGQLVKITVETEDSKSKSKFKNELTCIISTIRATGTSEEDTYEYGITTDMPGCYHAGLPPFDFIREAKIVLA